MSIPETMLVKLDHARALLNECRTVEDAKGVGDIAAAAQTYARQAKLGQEAENYAFEIRMRAERRMGEILLVTPRNVGAAAKHNAIHALDSVQPPSLAEMGISLNRSSQAQKLATLPAAEFEKVALRETTLKEAKLTEKQLQDKRDRMAPKFNRLKELEEEGVYIGSVWSFGKRNPYAGSGQYHGNSIPQIVENAVLLYTKPGALVVDPMAGSGTTADVCAATDRRCRSFDIQPENATDRVITADARDLSKHVRDGSADLVFWHPPYWNMVVYSHEPGDLSAMPWDQFLATCGDVLAEVTRMLKPGGVMVMLSGDKVQHGKYYPITRKLANLAESCGLTDSGTAIKTTINSTSQIVKGKTIWAELAHTENLKVEHDTINIFRK